MANYINWVNGNFSKILAVVFLSAFLGITAWGLLKIIDIPTTLSSYVLKTDYSIAHTLLSTRIDLIDEKVDLKFESMKNDLGHRLDLLERKLDDLNKFIRECLEPKIKTVPKSTG